MKIRKYDLSILLLLALHGLCFFNRAFAEDETAVINITASNTSELKAEKMYVRYDLPKELKKEDLVEHNGLELGYDSEETVYYLSTYVSVDPKTSKNFKVIVRDIWRIPDSKFDSLKQQMEMFMKNSETDSRYESGKIFAGKLMKQLDQIREGQAERKADLNTRSDFYRESSEQLQDIERRIVSQEEFLQEAERYDDIIKADKRIRFIIESKNTDKENPIRDTEIIKYLPEGIGPEQVLDDQGFDVRYDANAKLYYVQRKHDLAPGESKNFNIVILDIWRILESRLDQLQETAGKLEAGLAKSPYSQMAAYCVAEIKRLAGEIKESQAKAILPDDKIGVYSANIGRMQAIKEKIEQLRKMKEEHDARNKKSIKEVIKSVTPDVATTWKIIYATMGLLAFISIMLYILWWGQIKNKQIKDKKMGL